MSRLTSMDRLEVLGLVTGAFLVIVGIGTFLTPPWTTNSSTGAAMVQTLGIVLTIAVGALMMQLTYSGSLIPDRSNSAE
jgi:uncharacterized membrane protein